MTLEVDYIIDCSGLEADIVEHLLLDASLLRRTIGEFSRRTTATLPAE